MGSPLVKIIKPVSNGLLNLLLLQRLMDYVDLGLVHQNTTLHVFLSMGLSSDSLKKKIVMPEVLKELANILLACKFQAHLGSCRDSNKKKVHPVRLKSAYH